MKLVVLCNREVPGEEKPDDRYLWTGDTRFAPRVLGNLRSDPAFCTVCGKQCTRCRDPYDRKHCRDIAAVIEFPSVMPYVLERPATHLPGDVPPHDVLLAIGIHEQILLEIVRACGEWGTRGVVAPLEAPGWISGATRNKAHAVCEEHGIEIAFPKPFCSFRPPRGSVLAEFRETFHIGCPDVHLDVKDGRIREAHVNVSAACGATYCVARWLDGRYIRENVEMEVVSKMWHAYPCTASMERDPELGDETPLHVAGQAHYAILAPFKQVGGYEAHMVKSPLGTVVQKPVPPEENLRKIDGAKEWILHELARRKTMTLRELREVRGMTPPALNSAILILKKEGKIRTKGGEIRRA